MRSSKWVSESQFCWPGRRSLTGTRVANRRRKPLGTKIRRAMLLVLVARPGSMPVQARSQSLSSQETRRQLREVTILAELGPDLRAADCREQRLNNYAFDAFGPYPIAGAAFAAGINQWTNAPPEWNQGVEGLRQDDSGPTLLSRLSEPRRVTGWRKPSRKIRLYYRCECSGRISAAAPRCDLDLDGAPRRRRPSRLLFPALIAPYAGSMTAVYGWYPNRFGAKDAFRMGNYSLLGYMGGNIALEFFYSGPHSLISRMHLNNAHGSPDPGPNH